MVPCRSPCLLRPLGGATPASRGDKIRGLGTLTPQLVDVGIFSLLLLTRCWTVRDLCSIPIAMVLRKDQIEVSLQEEKRLIEDGKLNNPLDISETFIKLCEACRRGDVKTCQETITEGVNINARDNSDYTPLILV